MIMRLFIFLAVLLAGSVGAHAQTQAYAQPCNPPAAPLGSFGCMVSYPSQPTDLVPLWRPSLFPDSNIVTPLAGIFSTSGINLNDNTRLCLSTDRTACIYYNPSIGLSGTVIAINKPWEFDAGVTIPGGDLGVGGVSRLAGGVVVGQPSGGISGNLGPGWLNAEHLAVNGTEVGSGAACTSGCIFGGNVAIDGTLTLAPPAGNGAIISSSANGGTGNLFLSTVTGGLFRLSIGSASELEVDGTAIVAREPLNLFPPGVVGNSYLGAIHENVNFTGSTTDITSYLNLFQANSDTVAAPNGGVVMLGINDTFGGSAMTGARNVVVINATLGAQSGNTTNGTPFSGLQIYATSGVTDNGTGLTPGVNARGVIFGVNPVAQLLCANPASTTTCAKNYAGLVTSEFDLGVQLGASAVDVIGLNIGLLPIHAVHGIRDDEGLAITSGAATLGDSGGTVVGFTHMLDFGMPNAYFPGCPTCTMIFATGHLGGRGATLNGVDFHLIDFTGNALNMAGVLITGAGDLLTNGGAALANNATTGFTHISFTPSTPSGTPVQDLACEWNKTTHVLNCSDGGTWYHFTGTTGAG